MRLTRRSLLAAATATATPLPARAADKGGGGGSLGFVIHSFPVRNSVSKGFGEPARFLDYCRALGARTIQVDLGAHNDAWADALRDRARAASMTLEGSVSPPRGEADLSRFEAEIRTAKRA